MSYSKASLLIIDLNMDACYITANQNLTLLVVEP